MTKKFAEICQYHCVKDVFRNLSKIYDGTFFSKIASGYFGYNLSTEV